MKKVSRVLSQSSHKGATFGLNQVSVPMKIGIIREGKIPTDSRTPLTPEQCAQLIQEQGIQIAVEPSPVRCYPDSEYEALQIPLTTDLSDCDVLIGIKEVPVDQLIPNKTYLFFSHTIKEQAYNRKLLRVILAKNIRLIDYEVLTDEQGRRLIAFGKFAGMVGAHNAMWTWGKRTGDFQLPRMKDCFDYEMAKTYYHLIQWPAVKIVVTGSGRVSMGAMEVLNDMGILQVSPDEYLKNNFEEAVFTQLVSRHYVERQDGRPFHARDFYAHPEAYQSSFAPYTAITDIFINGIFWDPRAPAFFTAKDMRRPDFRIRVIADVTCDIAPESSVPSTLRPSSIANPAYGYDPETGLEMPPFQPNGLDVMAIDNLPSEMPRDASRAFGEQFMYHVLPELLHSNSKVIERATVALDGELGAHFQYLREYVGIVAV